MKLLVAGSRSISLNTDDVIDCLIKVGLIDVHGIADLHSIKEIVSGGAVGVDQSAESFAAHFHIPVKQFLPDYDTYPGRAPLVRNSKMAVYADALLLIWDGSSRGSADMKKKMEDLKKPIYEIIRKV